MAAPPVRWQWCSFEELSLRDLYASLALRQRVFVLEQNCVYLDSDGLDFFSMHLLGWVGASASEPPYQNEKGEVLVAYLRSIEPGKRFKERAIGRVVTAPEYRKSGLGRELMNESFRHVDGPI